MKIILLALVILTSFILTESCNNSKKIATTSNKAVIKLNGTWELTYISGPKIAFDGLYPDKKPSLNFTFPGTEASGNGSCNGFGCKVTTEGNKISFSNIISTMMACGGNGENLFFKTLETVTSYSINSNGTLTMIKGDIAVMTFVKKL
jgi:heat shock protein HslJ